MLESERKRKMFLSPQNLIIWQIILTEGAFRQPGVDTSFIVWNIRATLRSEFMITFFQLTSTAHTVTMATIEKKKKKAITTESEFPQKSNLKFCDDFNLNRCKVAICTNQNGPGPDRGWIEVLQQQTAWEDYCVFLTWRYETSNRAPENLWFGDLALNSDMDRTEEFKNRWDYQ